MLTETLIMPVCQDLLLEAAERGCHTYTEDGGLILWTGAVLYVHADGAGVLVESERE